MSEVGLDEGGILEALSKPIYTREWIEYVYGTKGSSKGKIVEEIKHEVSVSLSTVLGVSAFSALVALIQNAGFRDVLDKVGSGENIEDIVAGVGKLFGADREEFLNQRPPKSWIDAFLNIPTNWFNAWRWADHALRMEYRNKWEKGPTWQPPYNPFSH